MDCPHCHEENLLGAKMCAACGRNMAAAPPPFPRNADPTATQVPLSMMATEPNLPAPPRDGPDVAANRPRPVPPPPPSAAPTRAPVPRAGGAPVQVFCRVCLEGFERRPDDTGTPICLACRRFTPGAGADAGVSDVALHPATQDRPGVDPRAGGAIARRKPAARRASVSMGPAVALTCLVAGLGCLGVVTYAGREKDPAAEYMSGVKRVEGKFVVAPSSTGVALLESTLRVSLRHEVFRSNFAKGIETVLDLNQKSVQTADVAWVRDDAAGPVVETTVECRLAEQTGTALGVDGREAKAYPWVGHRNAVRLLLGREARTSIVDGETPIVGRDVPPCFTLRDIGAPNGAVAAGTSWRTDLMLPFFMTTEGGVLPGPFPCQVTYNGTCTQNGIAAFLFSVRGAPPQHPPAPIDDMNRTSGTVRGVVFIEARTGLVAEAHLKADVAAWLERGRIDDRVHVAGTLDVRRR